MALLYCGLISVEDYYIVGEISYTGV